jgi:hypothetical protein
VKRIAIVAVFAVGAATMAARPGNEFNLLTNLNGQEVRWLLPDGGPSLMSGSGIQCMDVRGLPAAANSTVELVPLNTINLCEVSTTSNTGMAGTRWDGGCGLNANDPNAGVPLQPLVPKYLLLKSTTTHLCQVSDAGTATTIGYSLQ